MESRNEAFGQGMVAGSPELLRQRMVAQAEAGGMYPGQNGKSENTFNAEQPYLSQALKAGY
jgi:hypothetical protein